jgi:hypothetical protein
MHILQYTGQKTHRHCFTNDETWRSGTLQWKILSVIHAPPSISAFDVTGWGIQQSFQEQKQRQYLKFNMYAIETNRTEVSDLNGLHPVVFTIVMHLGNP